jgi:hypothetical protein
MPITIDEKLFAHINTDPFLRGSVDLEGNQFAVTIGYLQQFLKHYKSTGGMVSPEVEQLLSSCTGLVHIESSVGIARMTRAAQAITTAAEKAATDVLALQGDEYVLLPGGWLASNGGHAIIYQIRVDENGDYLFCIHNSGSGLSFHAKKSDKEKELYNPVLTYKIPKEQSTKPDFKKFIELLLKAQVPSLHGQNKMGPEYLYKYVFEHLSYLGGKIVSDQHDQFIPYTAGQLSGTCAQHSLHQMLKSGFKDLDNYREFIYKFKAFSLDDYIAQLISQNALENIKLHGQIDKAIRHQLRMLNLKQTKDPSEDLFPLQYKEREIARLKGYLRELSKFKMRAPVEPSNESRAISPQVGLSIAPTKEVVLGNWVHRPIEPMRTNPLVLSGELDLLTQMDEVLRRCLSLSSTNQYMAVFEQLEQMFARMPLPIPPQRITEPLLSFYKSISSEAKSLEFYKKLERLQKYYYSSCEKILGSPDVVLPRMQITRLNIVAVTAHVNSAYPLVGSEVTSFINYISKITEEITVYSPKSPYLATDNPDLDARLLQLKALLPSRGGDAPVQYYQWLINTFPDLKAKLEQLFDTKYPASNIDPELETMRKQGYKSLYYFIKNAAALAKDVEFAPLIAKMDHQDQLERLYGDVRVRYLDEKARSAGTNLSIRVNQYNPSLITFDSVMSSQLVSCLTQDETLKQAKYGITKTPAAAALRRNVKNRRNERVADRSSNEIQLIPSEYGDVREPFSKYSCDDRLTAEQQTEINNKKIYEQELANREFFHLRISPETQIPVTLDYFNLHLGKLADQHTQVYLEANLFQTGLLLKKLTPSTAADFFKQFDGFIKNGLKFYEKRGLLSQESLFFIRLSYLVNQYAYELDPITFGQRKKDFLAQLSGHLCIQTDASTKSTLHYYRFLSMAGSEKEKLATEEELYQAVSSYFWVESQENKRTILDTDSRFQYQYAVHLFKRLARDRSAELNQALVLRLIKDVGVPIPGNEAEITVDSIYPVYSVKLAGELLYQVHIEQGLIFKGDMAFRTTPLDILNHPISKQFGLDRQGLCFTSPNQNVFVLERPPVSLRYIRDGAGFRIQKKWPNALGVEQWYEFTPLTREQAQYWQYSNCARSTQVSELMKQRDLLCWQNLDNTSLVMSDASNKILYDGKMIAPAAAGESARVEINPRDSQYLLCTQNSWMHNKFHKFEAQKFINVWLSPQGQTAEIRLDRYGIKCTAVENGQKIQWARDGVTYTLTDEVVFDPGVAQLVFKQGDKALCLLPIQIFQATKQRSERHEYYQYSHDTGASISAKLLVEIRKEHRNVVASWNYTNTEHFVALKLDKNGQPMPETSEEALYLCYVYLGSNQPEKAWATLADCDKRLGGFTGNYKELQYLSWIIDSLPFKDEDADDAEKSITNPAFVACKLKALSLYTQFASTSKELAIPKEIESARSANDLLTNHQIKQVKTFKNNIISHISSLYSLLQRMRRELPASYHLEDADARSLLNYYFDGKQGTKAAGSLGYEWVQLNLNQLHKEWEHLHAISEHRLLTPAERQRKAEIEEYRDKQESVARTSSRLEYRAHSFDFAKSLLARDRLNSRALLLIDNLQTPHLLIELHTIQEQAISKLILGISDNDLIEQLPYYVAIATSEGHSLLKPLLDFCSATLVANRNRSATNVSIIADVLYRLATHNKPLPEKLKYLPYRLGDGYNERGIKSFADLQCYVMKELKAPSMEIPQLVDDTSELLAKGLEIWASAEEHEQVERPQAKSLDEHYGVGEWLSPALKEFRTNWHQLELQWNTGHQEVALSDDAPIDYSGLSEGEARAGSAKYVALKALQQLAVKHLHDDAVLLEIDKEASAKQKLLIQEQEQLLSKLLALANQGPDDPDLSEEWAIDRASGKRKTIDKNALLKLYFHADVTEYRKETGLPATKINELHQLLLQFVAKGLQEQHCERILTRLVAAKDSDNALYYLAQTLCAVNRIDALEDPDLNAFQLHNNILLRTTQKGAVARLLKTTGQEQFDETVEKIIMGGGKSKVILPTLAQKKANGHNLVIIEVPRALLRTNYIDLRATSSLLYNQGVYLFEFNRDSDCSAKHLHELYDQLNEVIVDRKYMVTTGDALQSVELKYLELLLSRPDENIEEWHEQVAWAEKIVKLFRQRGDLIIDEAHQGLLLKNKLNYTFGDSSLIPKSILKHATDLFSFLSQVPCAGTQLQDQLIQRNSFADDGAIEAAIDELIKCLLTKDTSPLHRHIKVWMESGIENVRQQLEDYFYNKEGMEVPEFILGSSIDAQEQFAYYKEQISNILPFTLKRHEGEHYGPSQLQSKPVAERLVAIPYVANNVPNERSQFGNFLESINYSIQSVLIKGLPKELLKSVLDEWISQARSELYHGVVASIEDTAVAALFRSFIQGKSDLKFSQLNTENEEQLAELHTLLQSNTALCMHVLKTNILTKIRINDAILHSDAYNHVDMVRSCQGMTGTPWNYSTFHQRLSLSQESSLGTDAYVLRAIHDKKPAIHGIDYQNKSQFIKELFDRYDADANLRAVIDINASFKGIGNLEVAQEIAVYIRDHAKQFELPEPVKYVLFFNDKNELSALSVESNEVIRIGSSDPDVINARLNCQPSARFTYFDQSHTVGADIKQEAKCKALVLIDKNTHFQNFLQGSMRMRELLEGDQSIDLVVPSSLAEKSLTELASMMVASEQKQLKLDNFNATRSRMANLVRNEFMNQILAIAGPDAIERKRELLELAKSHFIEMDTTSFFERFGGIYQTKNTKEILEHYQQQLVDDWLRLLNESGSTPTQAEKAELTSKLEALVVAACAPGVCDPKQQTRKNTLDVEVEVQQEKQTQIEVLAQKETLEQTFNVAHRAMSQYSWSWHGNDPIDNSRYLLQFKTLEEVCRLPNSPYTPDYSPKLLASTNFYKTYDGQKDPWLDSYLKPVHAILFLKDERNGLRAVILTQEECADLAGRLKGESWICTTQHTLLAGKAPEGIQDNLEYQSLIEQTRYFNGEFNLLVKHDTSLAWMDRNYAEKIKFFTEHLWHRRETRSEDISALGTLFSVNKKVFQNLATAPWLDYRTFDWTNRYPDLKADDVPLFENLAKALHLTTGNWNTALNLQTIASDFSLTLEASGYLARYIEQLGALKNLFSLINNQAGMIKRGEKNLPLSILASLTLDEQRIKANLESLCPVIKGIGKQQEDESLKDYLLITALMTTLPMCKANPNMQVALAYNVNVTQMQLDELVKQSKTNSLIFHGLLCNKSSLINEQLIMKLWELNPDCDLDCLLALSKSSSLPKALYRTVLDRSKGTLHEGQIITALLCKKTRDLEILEYICFNFKLKEEHFYFVLATYEPLGALFDTLLTQAEGLDEITLKIKARKEDELYAQQINSAEDAETINTILQKPHAGFCAQLAAAKHSNISTDTLANLVEHTKEQALILAVLARPDFQGDLSIEKQRVLNAFVRNERLTQTTLFDDLLEQTSNSGFAESLLRHKMDSLAQASIAKLLSKPIQLTDAPLELIASFPRTSPHTLATILNRSENPNIVGAVIDRKDLSAHLKENERLALALVNNPQAYAEYRDFIIQMLQETPFTSVLQSALAHIADDEGVYQGIISNQKSDRLMLQKIALATKNKDTIEALLARKDIASEDRANNEKIYLAIAKNLETSLSSLTELALRTSETETLCHIIQHQHARAEYGELLPLYLNITRNDSLDYPDLEVLAQRTLPIEIISKILGHRLLKTSSSTVDKILGALVVHSEANLADESAIESLAKLNQHNEAVWGFLAKQKTLSPDTLRLITDKSKDPTVIATVLSREDVRVSADQSDRSYDPFYIKLVLNQATPIEAVQTIADGVRSPLVADAILKRTESSVANDPERYTDILNSLAKSPYVHDQGLVQRILDLTSNMLVLKHLLVFKSKVLSVNSLKELLKKPQLSEDVLIKIVKHNDVDHEILGVAAQKAQSPMVIEAILAQLDKFKKAAHDDSTLQTRQEEVLTTLVVNTKIKANQLTHLVRLTENAVLLQFTLDKAIAQGIKDSKFYAALITHGSISYPALTKIAANLSRVDDMFLLLEQPFMKKKDVETDKLLIALAANSDLASASTIERLLPLASNDSIFNEVLITTPAYLTPHKLQSMIESNQISAEQLTYIAQQTKTALPLLLVIAQYSTSWRAIEAVSKHTSDNTAQNEALYAVMVKNKNTSVDVRKAIASQSGDASVLAETTAVDGILRGDVEAIYCELAKNKHTPLSLLKTIATNTKMGNVLEIILVREDIKNPSDERNDLLVVLIKNKSLNIILVKKLIESVVLDGFYDVLVEHKKSILDKESISLLLQKGASRLSIESLHVLAGHNEVSVESVLTMLNHAGELKLQAVAGYDLIVRDVVAFFVRNQDKPLDFTDLFKSLINFDEVLASDLALIAKKTTSIEVLDNLAQRRKGSALLSRALAVNPITPPTILVDLAIESQDAEVISGVLSRDSDDLIESLLAHEQLTYRDEQHTPLILAMLTRKLKTSYVCDIASETQSISVVMALLSYAQQLNGIEQEMLYLTLFNNHAALQHITTEQLIAIQGKSESDQVLSALDALGKDRPALVAKKSIESEEAATVSSEPALVSTTSTLSPSLPEDEVVSTIHTEPVPAPVVEAVVQQAVDLPLGQAALSVAENEPAVVDTAKAVATDKQEQSSASVEEPAQQEENLLLLAQTATNEEVLRRVFAERANHPEFYEPLVNNKNTPTELLVMMVLESQNEQLISLILSQNKPGLISGILEHGISEALSKILISKGDLGTIKIIALKTTSQQIIADLNLVAGKLEKQQEQDEIYQALISNPNTKANRLTELYKATKSPAIRNAIEARGLHVTELATSLPSAEQLALIQSPGTSVKVLAAIADEAGKGSALSEQVLHTLLEREALDVHGMELRKELILNNISSKLDQLSKIKIFEGREDSELIKYIADKRKQAGEITNHADLDKLKLELEHTLTNLESPQVKAIQRTIELLSKNKGIVSIFYPEAKRKKIEAIQNAMLLVPIAERHQVVHEQSDASFAVRRAIAEHRSPISRWRHSSIFDAAAKTINKDEAANSYKNLEQMVEQIVEEERQLKR